MFLGSLVVNPMALTISLTAGYTFTDGEIVTNDKLNLMGNPTINLEGSISSVSVADGSITTAKLAANALSADATGRGKMAAGYFSADATGRGKFAAGFIGTDATSYALFAAGFFAPFAPVVGSVRNLAAAYASASTLTVAADEVVVKNSANQSYLLTGLSGGVTVNIAAAVGINALDTGAEASSTWYYIWAVWDGTTAGCLLSTSSTTPSVANFVYTHKALIGAVRNDGSSNFISFTQQDRQIWLNLTVLFTAKAPAGSNTYEAYQAGGGGSDVDLRTLVPPIAKRLQGVSGFSTNNNGAVAIAGDANGLGATSIAGNSAGAITLDGFDWSGRFEIPLKTAQTFYWKAHNTSANSRVSLSGYAI